MATAPTAAGEHSRYGYWTAETIRYANAAHTARLQTSAAKGAHSRSALLVVAGKIARSSLIAAVQFAWLAVLGFASYYFLS